MLAYKEYHVQENDNNNYTHNKHTIHITTIHTSKFDAQCYTSSRFTSVHIIKFSINIIANVFCFMQGKNAR